MIRRPGGTKNPGVTAADLIAIAARKRIRIPKKAAEAICTVEAEDHG